MGEAQNRLLAGLVFDNEIDFNFLNTLACSTAIT